MFKQHLEMIGRNETPSKKAKFWQSYVRSLKGNFPLYIMWIYAEIVVAMRMRSWIENIYIFCVYTHMFRIRWYPSSRHTKSNWIMEIRIFTDCQEYLWWTIHSIRKNNRCRISLPSSSSWNIWIFTACNLLASLQQTR